jgi:hypothetical protein
MNIHLTPEQLQALDARDGTAPRVIDPRNDTAYVLVRETEYESVREALEEEQQQQVIRSIGLRNAIGRMEEAP